jgi:FkbM family methyltransferase
MVILHHQPIPQWLHDEVAEYFVPLHFEPKTILDIGANVGAFAQTAHKYWPKAHIVCCEPMPYNLSYLRRNVPLGTEIISAAIRAHSGIDEIFIGDNFLTSGFFQLGRQTQQSILVECVAARELPSCELVKIDTEGCEIQILTHLPLQATRAIFVEYHSRADADAIKAMLASHFRLVSIDAGQDLGTMSFIRR